MFEKDKTLLEKLVSKISEIDLTIIGSYTNLIEFSKSPKAEQVESLTRNLMKLKPSWIDDFETIQKIELRNFLSCKFNFIENQNKRIIYPSFAQLLSSNSSEFFLGSTPLDFIKTSAKAEEISAFNEKRIESAQILNYLSTSEVKRKTKDTEIKIKMLTNYFKPRLPITERNTKSEEDELINFCLNNINSIYKACPAIHAETLLSEYRTSNAKRKAKESDLDDLFFSIPALAYCDAIITNDGFLFSGLESVSKKLYNNACKIYKDIDTFCIACS